ncbi:MAG: MBL fold metallo-hydrolase [Gammaproteobacteria bacterium]|nr:MBL fold metallo-hydrolase [Gammaproteobacteria bacterium]
MPRNPFYDPGKPHHKPDGFRNPPGSPPGHRLTRELAREAAHFLGELLRLRTAPHPFDDQHVVAEPQVLDALRTQTAARHVTWMGHACFLLHLNGRWVLTDPYLSDYAAPLPTPATRRLIPPAIATSRIPQVDLILLSHNHYDHMDREALKILAQRFPEARIVVPLGLKAILQRWGFRHVHEHDWWDKIRVAGLEVTLVPAVHTSKRGIGDTNRTLWCGFAFRDGDWQGYFAGDTAYGEVFKVIGERVGPFDLGLVPIGAYAPRRLMHPVHCTPEDAVQIGVDIGARQVIGMHWGTIRLTTEPLDEPRQRFLAVDSPLPRSVMRIGEVRAL